MTDSFDGTWSTTYGDMQLREQGLHVQGTYTHGGTSSIEGEREGRVLRGFYAEPDGSRGRVIFKLSKDGLTFGGRWRLGLEEPLELDHLNASRWLGRRVLPGSSGL